MGCPEDSDKDVVYDYRDRCPDTRLNVKIDEYDCPFDSDNDKIANYKDLCPNTPADTYVGKNGCPLHIRYKVQTHLIYFIKIQLLSL